MTTDKSKPGSLLIKGGHLIDPAAKINAPMDILLRDGRVAEIALPNKIRGSADEKSAVFKKYKGKINIYLSQQGIDMKKAQREWSEQQKEKPTSNPAD